MESPKESGCQAPPEGPILCINNCGFFGSAATMNMCSKCHKDMVVKQQQAKLAASSIENLVNGSSSNEVGAILTDKVNLEPASVDPKPASPQLSPELGAGPVVETKAKEGPNRCATCRKRIGLTGFSCRCGNLFCSIHRYTDKHDCQFDYRSAGQDAIAKANPIVKAEKLDKI